MSIDKSNPQLGYALLERVEAIEQLNGVEWQLAHEVRSQDQNQPLQRKFSELEFIDNIELLVNTGEPPGHPNSYNYHYQVRSIVNEHQYTANKVVSPVLPLRDQNDFYGWRYNIHEFYKNEYWQDELVRYVSWQVRSRPAPGLPASDIISLYSNRGQLITATGIEEPNEILFNTGRTWGLRALASTPMAFQVDVLKTNNEPVDLDLGITGMSLPAPEDPPSRVLAPDLLRGPIVRVTGPSYTRPYYPPSNPEESTDPVIVIDQIDLYLYGIYWSMDLELIEVYKQQPLMHPPGTPLITRLKPPGKSHLSDLFNNYSTDDLEPNADGERSGKPRLLL